MKVFLWRCPDVKRRRSVTMVKCMDTWFDSRQFLLNHKSFSETGYPQQRATAAKSVTVCLTTV